MRPFNKKQLNLKDCLGVQPDSILEKRLAFKDGETPKDKPAEKDKPVSMIELQDFQNSTEYKEDRKNTLVELAQKDNVLAQNFEQAIQESLSKAGYDKKIDDFWSEMGKDYKCKKVEVKDSKIHFYDEKGIEVAPKFSAIPIVADLSKFQPDIPTKPYLIRDKSNPNLVTVDFKNWKETSDIKIKDIIFGARDGTKIIVTAPNGKPRNATFSEDGQKAYYNDGKEAVRIYTGYKIELIKSKTTVVPEGQEVDNWGNLPSAGEYKFGKTFSADDYISMAITGKSVDAKTIDGFDENNANLQRIRKEMVSKGYTVADYTKFLKEKGAIKKDRINLLVDVGFIEGKALEEKQKKDMDQAIEQGKTKKAEFNKEREKYFMPENLTKGAKFMLKDAKMIALVDDAKKWADAWASDSIEGLKALKGIIISEPSLFGDAAKNPDKLRDRIREAIANGKDDRIYFEDLINDILKIRMPSLEITATKDSLEKLGGEKFSTYYERIGSAQNLDQIKKANGFLKKLGTESYESARVFKTEGESIWLNLAFEGAGYTVKVNPSGAVVGEETIKIYRLNSTTPYPLGNGYQNGGRFKVSTLAEGDFSEKNDVKKWFRDCVTPEMTYANYLEIYKLNFNADGTPKDPNLNPEFIKKMRDVIIGGNRFLLQLTELKYVEKAGGVMGINSMEANRGVDIKDKKFVEIVEDDKKWAKEWEAPTLNITKDLRTLFNSDPILQEVSQKYPDQVAKRVQDCVTNWSNSSLDFGDVVEYILKGLELPSGKKIKSSSDLVDEYNLFFYTDGSVKKEADAATLNRYRALMKAANKVLMAFEGKSEAVQEISEGTIASQFLRNAKLEKGDYNVDKVYDADAVLSSYNGKELHSLKGLSAVPNNGVGLQISDGVLGDQLTDKVVKNKLDLFRQVFQTFSLFDLVAQGCIKKGSSTSLPNQEFYVIDKLPDTLKSYLSASAGNGVSNFELIAAQGSSLTGPEVREVVNPQSKLQRIAEFFFPLKDSARSYADVGEGVGKGKESERIYNRLDYSFAYSQFKKDICDKTEDGMSTYQINQQKMLSLLSGYLELFDSKLDMQYGPEKAPQVRKSFTDVFGETLPVPLTMESLDKILKDSKKAEVLSKAIREGFVFAHEQKIEKQRTEAMEKLQKNFDSWRKSLTAEDLEALRKALSEAKVPAEEIPVAIEKLLPVWFGLGIDTASGLVGVGVGVLVPIQLGKDGKYGTIVLGGGVALGGNYKEGTAGAGISVGTAYKTPKLGPFSLFAGGAVGVGLDTKGNFGIGGGIGAGVSIEWGTVGSTKISSDIGIAYIPGMPFPLPGILLKFEKDHEASIANLRKEAFTKFGLDTVDAEVLAAGTLEGKKAAIGKNDFFRKAYSRSHKDVPFDKADPVEVLKAYETYKANLEETIRENYDPALFLNISRLIIGFGIDPDTGKFIFLVGGSIVTGKEVKTFAFEGKSKAVMDQEVMVSHWDDLAKRYNAGKIDDPKEKSEVQSLIQSGKLLTIPGSKDLAVYIPKENPAPVPLKTGEKLDSTSKLEKRFNEVLKPLNMRVEYDPGKQLFEIKFNDWNDNTNYDIAVDSKMTSGGIIFEAGHIYLANDFSSNSLTMLRADYEYPFKKEGKNYHSIITLSDSPFTPAHEIYQSSREILSSKGGIWYKQQGLGYDKYMTETDSHIWGLTGYDKYKVNSDKLSAKSGENVPSDNDDTKKNIDKLSINEAEKGVADDKACTDFAKGLLKKYPIDYRKKSNKETENNKFEDLNKLIVDEWKKTHGDKEPNPAELNLIRLKIMDASFHELGDIKDKKARQEAFKQRLEFTKEVIIKPRFENLVKENQKKYAEGDPRRIRMSADDLVRVVMARLKTIDVNSEDGSKLLSQIDRTSTVAGTLGIFGFRGEVYGGDNKDPDQKMIGSSVDYAKFLKEQPNSAEADLARLIFEETSKLPPNLDSLQTDTPTDTMTLLNENIYDLFRADLSQKVISTLFTPYSKDLFAPGLREEILRLAANKDQLSIKGKNIYNQDSAKAILALNKLVNDLRKAEASGEKYYVPTSNPDYRFVLNYEVQDGVYKKCTNYSMWINEGLELQMRTSKLAAGPDIMAGYGVTTGTTVTKTQIEYTTINVVAAVAIKPKGEDSPPPGKPPKEEEPAAPAKGKVDQEAGSPSLPPKGEGTPQAPAGEASGPSGSDV